MNINQAVNLYHAAFQPINVGACGDEPVTAETPASALARHHDLPYWVSSSTTLSYTAKQFGERKKVVAFLREWADALDQQQG